MMMMITIIIIMLTRPYQVQKLKQSFRKDSKLQVECLQNCQPDPSNFLLKILDRLKIFLALVFPWADFTDCLSLTSHGPRRIPFFPQACIFYAPYICICIA
eukprot:XP_014781431.1 PREDICTED: uncharacterized protein LOC106877141 [Octopus bimaculoides]